MNDIKKLPKELIDQIAAGEVVERPASVVKELVENSVDAGADNIEIEIMGGGIDLIKVSDNGVGMDKQNALLSVEQHATSKLNTQEDLFAIKTMGFRGEALASISAVSEFSLISKTEKSLSGIELSLIDGKIETKEIGVARGTTVRVSDLFGKIPVRKKYLKTAVTEYNHIVDLFLKFALGYPKITWRLLHNNKKIYHFPAEESLKRISDVLGENIGRALLPISILREGISINGFIGKPEIARNNRKLQYLFINERPVNEYVIAKQIKEAYNTLIANNLFPVYILNIAIDNKAVDVNVHPRKLEVRFSDPQAVYRNVYKAVTAVLDSHDLTKSFPTQKENYQETDFYEEKKVGFSIKGKANGGGFFGSSIKQNEQAVIFNKEISELNKQIDEIYESEQITPSMQSPAQPFKIVGQVKKAYIIVETEHGMKIYDQHACSERIRYERLKDQWKIGRLASQKLLLPQNLELSPQEYRLTDESEELLNRLGFEVALLSGQTVSVSAVPQFLVDSDIKELLMEILGNLLEISLDILDEEKIQAPIDRILKSMACKGAIKFGDELSERGMEALINDMDKQENPYSCIHGRPAVVELRENDLKKLFAR